MKECPELQTSRRGYEPWRRWVVAHVRYLVGDDRDHGLTLLPIRLPITPGPQRYRSAVSFVICSSLLNLTIPSKPNGIVIMYLEDTDAGFPFFVGVLFNLRILLH